MDYTNGVYDSPCTQAVERYKISFKFDNGETKSHYVLSTSLKEAIETVLRMIESWNLGANLIEIFGRAE